MGSKINPKSINFTGEYERIIAILLKLSKYDDPHSP